jgi:hypothetical protein
MTLVQKISSAEVTFHAYILGGILNLRWNTETMTNRDLYAIIREYVDYVYGTQEWPRLKLLDAIRDKTRNEIKEDAKRKLSSLFIGRSAWPLALPKEAPEVKFDIDYIYKLKQKVDEIRRDETMNANDNQGNAVSNEKAPRVHLPAGINIETLTMDNFRSLTGRRFRVTTEQQNRIKAGTLTREQAFAEFIADLKKGG